MKSAALPWKRLVERTSVQCLLRNQQLGRYYAKVTLQGKQKWFSLDTDVFSVAKLHLGDKIAEVDRQRRSVAHVAAGKARLGEIIDVYLARTCSGLSVQNVNFALLFTNKTIILVVLIVK